MFCSGMVRKCTFGCTSPVETPYQETPFCICLDAFLNISYMVKQKAFASFPFGKSQGIAKSVNDQVKSIISLSRIYKYIQIFL